MLIRDLKKQGGREWMKPQNRIRIAWHRLNTNRVCPTCAQSLTIAARGTGGARVCWRHCIASSSAFLSPITCNMPTSNRMLLPFGNPTICTICRWLTYWNRLRARTFPCHMRWPELWLLPILPRINARCRSIAGIAATASWSPKWCQHGRPWIKIWAQHNASESPGLIHIGGNWWKPQQVGSTQPCNQCTETSLAAPGTSQPAFNPQRSFEIFDETYIFLWGIYIYIQYTY